MLAPGRQHRWEPYELRGSRTVLGARGGEIPRATYLPLYRQSAILERDTGVSISRATMDGWIMRVGGMLIPVVGAMGRELVAGSYIQADETPVPVQMSDGRGKNHQAFLWQYGKPGGNVVFDFRMGRGRDGPVKFLGEYEGILQTDGYAAYGRVGGSRMVHAACWKARSFSTAIPPFSFAPTPNWTRVRSSKPTSSAGTSK